MFLDSLSRRILKTERERLPGVLQICLARKRTERVLGPPPAVGDNENDAALLQEHRMHTADEVRRMRGAFQTVRIRGQVNLILRAPRWRPLPGKQFKFIGVRRDRVLIPGEFL